MKKFPAEGRERVKISFEEVLRDIQERTNKQKKNSLPTSRVLSFPQQATTSSLIKRKNLKMNFHAYMNVI